MAAVTALLRVLGDMLVVAEATERGGDSRCRRGLRRYGATKVKTPNSDRIARDGIRIRRGAGGTGAGHAL